MPQYTIRFYNDMGHLTTKPDISFLPRDIYDFARSKAKLYLYQATDLTGYGALYFILKDGLQRNWTYYKQNLRSPNGVDEVTITFDIDTFDPTRMRQL
jgi:hypothetical protein